MKTKQELYDLSQELQANQLTMVDQPRFDMILRHLDNIEKINGDVVECGCWKGGFSIFLGHTFPDKTLWVCDSFEGFQPLEIAKYKYNNERHVPSYNLGHPNTENDFTLDCVIDRFNSYQLNNPNRIRFVKGFVKDSLPNSDIKKISLLRIDVDAYSATKEVLDELYDKVEVGGYIIFDDSCLYETADAIRDFFKEHGIENYVLHTTTDEKIDLSTNTTTPCGCYIIKS